MGEMDLVAEVQKKMKKKEKKKEKESKELILGIKWRKNRVQKIDATE